jgi:phospholipid/cholesterol/gamma-HCH transport system substrate-binding protein
LKLSREVKTGIFAIMSIVLFVAGYNFLKGSQLMESGSVFYVKYDNIAGLEPSAPVTVNGMQVGKVRDVFLETKKGGKVIVEFGIEKEFEFSKSSTIEIYSSGFIGGNNLAVIPDYSSNEMARSGDTINGRLQAGIIDGLFEKFTPLEKSILATLSKLDTVLTDLDEVMDDKTKSNLRQSIAGLNETIASFNGAAQKMDALLTDNKAELDSTFVNLDKTMANFAKFSDSLAQMETGKMITELQGTITKLNTITGQIEQGEGSIGKLLKDEKLYDNLEGATKQLENLLEDMKLNPKRYVHFSLFGKRPKPYESTEE